MPRESYKYIPMAALEDLMFEFRMNPFAMFTSGYTNDTSLVAGTTQQRRVWAITKFEIVVEMQYFEPDVERIVLD